MVTKRYIKRGGKVFGPYYYESYRDNSGRVKKRYIPDYKPENKKSTFAIIGISLGIVAVLVMVFLFISQEAMHHSITGRAIYSGKEIYKPGEPISGKIRLVLDAGESIPSDTQFSITLGDIKEEFILSDFVDLEPVYGTIYAKGSDLSGEGMVFGIPGKEYQQVDFEIEIYKEQNIEEETTEQPPTTEETPAEPEQPQEEPPQEEPPAEEESSSPITGQATAEINVRTISGSTSYENPFTYELEEGEKARVIKVTSNGEEIPKSEISLDTEDNTLTVSTEYTIEGFGENFKGGKDAMIFEIDLSDINLEATSGDLVIQITYEGTEIAYSEEPILISSTESEPPPPLTENNETNKTKSELKLIQEIPNVRITEDNIIIELKDYFSGADWYSAEIENIDVSTEGSLMKLTPKEGFKGARKATIVAGNDEETIESNPFLILVSSGAVSIKTTRDQIKIGDPVKWKMQVTKDISENTLNVEIPKKAKNVEIVAIKDGKEETIETAATAGILTGNVIIEVKLDKNKKEEKYNPPIVSNFKVWFASVRKKFYQKLEFKSEITGRATEQTPQQNIDETVDIPLEEPEATEYVIEYTTAPPEATEEETSSGKIITISAPEEVAGLYTDIIAYTYLDNKIPISQQHQIKLYWYNHGELSEEEVEKAKTTTVDKIPETEVIEEISTTEDPTNPVLTGNIVSAPEIKSGTYTKEAILFDAYDLDFDGRIDYIEWVVPHLSNQTYELVIEITNAEHLDENKEFVSDIYTNVSALDNIWSETIPENHYVRVTFQTELTSNNDITLYPRAVNGTPKIEVYEVNGSETIVEFETLIDNQYNKIYLTNLQNSQDTFDLKVLNGNVQFDHIVDPADTTPPDIEFGAGTPSDGTTQINTDIYVDLSTSDDAGDHYAFLDFDRDVLLWMPMDDVNASGDPTDLSSYSNNGTKGGDANQTASGAFGASFSFDGDNDYIDTGKIFSQGQDITLSAWVKPSAITSQTIIGQDNDGLGNFDFSIADESGHLSFISGDNSWTTSSLAVSSTGYFTHVAVSYNGTQAVFYSGGYQETPSNITIEQVAPEGTNFLIGPTFDGSIDEVLVFNRSLTYIEVSSLFYAAVQYSHNFTSLSDGAHTFTGFAVDDAGNKNQTELRTVTIEDGSITQCQNLTLPNTVYTMQNNVSTTETCFIIGADNITLDGRGFSIIYGNQSNDTTKYYGVHSVYDQTVIKNLTITRGSAAQTPQLTYGIYFNDSSNGAIENINTNSNYRGIYFYLSSNNTLTDITANDNTRGIYIYSSSDNNFTDVTANNNTDGIYLYINSNNNQLTNITANNNTNQGVYIYQSSGNILTSITANNNGDGINIYSNSDNTELTNITTNNNINGISVHSNNNQLTDVTANNNTDGITLNSASSNNLTNIIANNNTAEGIYLGSSSDNNQLINVTANNNADGLYIHASDNNQLADISTNNNVKGIYIYSHSDNNNLTGITANNNTYGVYIYSGSENNLLSDVAANENVNGLFIHASANNNVVNGIVSFSKQNAIQIAPDADCESIPDNNTLNNITITSTNASFYDINFTFGLPCPYNTQLIDMPHIGNYSLSYAGGTIIVRNTQYGEIRFLENVNGSGTNFTADVEISNNSATVRSNVNPGLNHSANVTFYNLPTFSTPAILRNSESCPAEICHNFTSLNAETVVFNVSYWTSYSIGDVTPPDIEFIQPTPSDGEKTDNTTLALYVNVTTYNDAEISFIRYRLFNSTADTINETITNSTNTTFEGLVPDTYTYNAYVQDSTGKSRLTIDRTLIVLPSCFNISSECIEGSSCIIEKDCVMYTGLCNGEDCNFTLLTTNSTIYTLYDSNGNGRDLHLKLTSNTYRAPLKFLTGGSIVLSGKDGSDLGSGSDGGSGGTLNITVPDLLNTTNANFTSLGGYTTAPSGPGGDGGDVILNFHGLIRNFTDSYYYPFPTSNKPSLIGGDSLGGGFGETGAIVYNKDLTIPRDVDVTGEGVVGSSDWGTIKDNYNNITEDSGFKVDYDINGDGRLNIVEIANIGFEYLTR